MKRILFSLAIAIPIYFILFQNKSFASGANPLSFEVVQSDSLHFAKQIEEAKTLYYSDVPASRKIVDALLLDSTLYSNKQIGYTHYLSGQLYRADRHYQKAQEAGLKAIQYYLENTEELDHELSHTYMLLGNCSRYLANYYEAIDFLFKGLENLPLHYNQEIETGLLINIGIIYSEIDDYEAASTYYNEALSKASETDTSNLIYIHNNLGHLLEEQEKFEPSLYHYNKGLCLANEQEIQYFQLLININLAHLYLSLNSTESSRSYIDVAKNILETYDDRYLSSYVLIIESNLLLQTCPEDILVHDIEALILELKKDGTIKLAHSASTVLKEYYSYMKDFEKAFFYIEEIDILEDKLYDIKNLRNTIQLSSDKVHNLELVQLNNKKEQLKLMFTSIILLTFIIGCLFYLLYEKQKTKTTHINKLLDHEKYYRKKLLKSTHSNYQRKLQDSKLAFADVIYENISMQLHDDIASSLAGIRFSLSSITLKEKEPVISRAIRYLDELYYTTRDLSHDVNPSFQSYENFNEALQEYFKYNSSIPVHLQLPVDESMQGMDPKIKIELFRIIKELTTNANKHSKASQIRILISNNHSSVYTSFSDNGIGMKRQSDGLGLRFIRKRIQLLDGFIKIAQLKPHGTIVRFGIPVYKNAFHEMIPQ